KSVEELRELREAGLAMLYVGAESGDDEVLERVNKGETFESTEQALTKAGDAGMQRSVMILNGLGGKSLSEQHALSSARLMNATQPEFVSTLVVSFPQGMERYRERFPDFEALDQQSLFLELKQFIETLELKNTVFRSDHASNALVLKGILGADKERLLEQVQNAIERPERARLRPDWMRGL
ncbi:radical SAM protein, partial [Halopseudomonas sp.]|uniref:radical SAM protein n=1 Tax=Halopseudomonas sp. TaxID=2901191 RepID=UPI0035679EF4